jgi:hypothetical protein
MSEFKIGDIVRYARDGASAIFKITEKVGDRFYGMHVLGGIQSACPERVAYGCYMAHASPEDLAFCRKQRPEWFT